MQSAENRLAKGTMVYMIGNVTSKILQMLILPIITASLLTSEYGYYDLIITTISLVTPIITFQMIEGMFRNMFNAPLHEQETTVSTVTAFLGIGFIVLGGLLILGCWVIPTIQYPFLIYLNYVSAIIFNYFQKLARCQSKNIEFAISGVINTIVVLAGQALVLLVLDMKVDGMLFANCISYFVASLYLALQLNVRRLLKFSAIRHSTLYSLLKYSAPLVPNSMGWWLVSSSDRYIIAYMLSSSANGIYSIAGKFSQLLTFVISVFQLAWQESAIIEENSSTRDKFYTNTFNAYIRILMGGYLVILPFIKLLYPYLVDLNYQEGYLYNPLLLIGAIFAAFSQFYGSAYLVFKRTRGAFSTTIVAAIVNIIIGIGLIRWLGLFAPALGTAFSFLIQWILRARQMKNYFKVHVDIKCLVTLLSLMTISTFVYYMDNLLFQLISMGLGVIIFCLFNKSLLQFVLSKLIKKH